MNGVPAYSREAVERLGFLELVGLAIDEAASYADPAADPVLELRAELERRWRAARADALQSMWLCHLNLTYPERTAEYAQSAEGRTVQQSDKVSG